MAHFRASLAAVFALLLWLPVYAAETVVDAGFDGASLDLMPYLQAIDSEGEAISVELPITPAGERSFMELEPRGPERVHRWVLLTVANTGAAPRDLVVSAPHQGFVGSGLFWPKESGSRFYNIAVAGKGTAQPIDAAGADALSLRLDPETSLSIAMELKPAGLAEITLWKRPPFDAQTRSSAFFRGVVLGIAGLMGLAMLSLYAVRSNPAFPYAALFAAASIAFIALESGYLPYFNAMLPVGVTAGQEVRAIVESTMVTGLILCLVTFVDLRKRWPAAGNSFLMVAGLTLALPVYGWFEPASGSGIARILFAITAAAGLFVIVLLWREGVARAQASLLTWSMIVAWTLIAALSVFALGQRHFFEMLLVNGLALVLITMGFTLAQFAFNRGFLNQRFFEEAGRRALALTGSRQFVWDWQAEERALHVSDDLEQTLGHRPGTIERGGTAAWYDLIHPADREAYAAATDAAERNPGASFSQEFRLRRADGTYRWFVLRARSLPGSGGRVARCIGTLADITRSRRAQDQLLSDAVYDRVTGLPNRALLIDRIGQAVASLASDQTPGLYLLLIDLDRFRAVNDGLGHEAGDGLLNITGNRLLELAGPENTVARLPGAQFAVLFNAAKAKREIVPFTEEIRAALAKPITLRSREVFLTASIGVAAYRDKAQTAEGMLKEAAIALYEAKRRGKGAVEFFRISMRDDRSELVVLESDLRRAVERNEIEVVYQPIARLSDMELAGFEALVRWRRPGHGLVEPDNFIAVAETIGMINEIGRHVLIEAARQLGIWQRAFRPNQPLFVAVNVSSSQLLGAGLIDDVRQIMGREGVERGTFKIEITESVVMERPEAAAQVLTRLLQMGVGLACDDFGTGHSSLGNLRRLPFDTLKVDRSFIDPDQDDAKAATVLESIMALAHRLGLKVVAEGVQNQEQVERLRTLGCDFGQGYFIGEPITAKQVVDALSGLPYAAGKSRSALTALWGRVAGSPPPIPVVKEKEPEPQAPIVVVKSESAPPPLPAEQPLKAAPSLGSAPMAPRARKPDPAKESEPAVTEPAEEKEAAEVTDETAPAIERENKEDAASDDEAEAKPADDLQPDFTLRKKRKRGSGEAAA